MVTPDCYPVVRRYGTRMNIYPSYPERRGTAYPIHTESRTIMSDRDEPQRKRIAVAVCQNLSLSLILTWCVWCV